MDPPLQLPGGGGRETRLERHVAGVYARWGRLPDARCRLAVAGGRDPLGHGLASACAGAGSTAHRTAQRRRLLTGAAGVRP